jgi:hypothetical protein
MYRRAQLAVNALENHGEIKMKKSLIVLAAAASIMVAGFVGVAQAQKAKKVVYVSSEQATYKPVPQGGPSMAVLHSDPDTKALTTFTKFALGLRCWHAHPHQPRFLRRHQGRLPSCVQDFALAIDSSAGSSIGV